MFRDEITRFDVVRYDRVTGKREVLQDRAPIVGHWCAEEEVQKLQRTNRDPLVSYFTQPTRRKA